MTNTIMAPGCHATLLLNAHSFIQVTVTRKEGTVSNLILLALMSPQSHSLYTVLGNQPANYLKLLLHIKLE